jgi:hypothetical protein
MFHYQVLYFDFNWPAQQPRKLNLGNFVCYFEVVLLRSLHTIIGTRVGFLIRIEKFVKKIAEKQ